MKSELTHGDCYAVIKTYKEDQFESVITDPPYGVNYKGAAWDSEIPPQEFLEECLRVARGAVIFFGAAVNILDFATYDPQPERMLAWAPRFTLSHTMSAGIAYRFHPIWAWRLPKSQPILKWDVIDTPTAMRQDYYHPAAKPVPLMLKLVGAFGGAHVLDPFMGIGSTGVACAILGRDFTGIEISEEYFKVAQVRLAKAKLQPLLIVEQDITQLELED